MSIFTLAGFPEVSNKIELPNIASLLSIPWFQYADIEEARKYGGEFYKELIDKIPLSNSRKNVLITSRVQYLTPSKLSIKFVDRWHTDGSGLPLQVKQNDIMHLLISKCTAVTEFNETPFVETQDIDPYIPQIDLNHYLEANKEALNLQGRAIEPERFVTFTVNHAHRAVQPAEPEFRFMFRVIESDIMEPQDILRAHINESFAYHEWANGGEVAVDPIENTAAYKNIEKVNGKIIIHT